MSLEPVKSRRVLIAEDVQVIAMKMAQALRGDGYEVDTAQDGEECLQKVGSFKPDLIILDIMMPKIHGIDVMRQIRSDKQATTYLKFAVIG